MLLYIHIPFCDSKCNYCAFNSYVGLYHLKQEYMLRLYNQLQTQIKTHKVEKFNTVFIGGGTPSCIEADEYKPIFNLLQKYTDEFTEITIEANPNSATLKWQKDMFELGVNRISFGIQSFNDEKLKFLNRNHSKDQAIEAIKNAKKIGFKKINCDIIYDTKLDTKQLIDNDIDFISMLPIDHVSAYSLTLEEGTSFYNKSNVRVENIDMANYIFSSLKSLGFEQYEISNFAKTKDSQCKHNIGYWKYEQYLGIGAGAIGTIEETRTCNTKDIEEFIKDQSYIDIERLTKDDILIEKTLLGLRSNIGICLNNYTPIQLNKIDHLIENNNLTKIKNMVFSNDFMLADELALYIME